MTPRISAPTGPVSRPSAGDAGDAFARRRPGRKRPPGGALARAAEARIGITYGRYSQDTQDSLEDQHDMNAETADDLDAAVVATFEDEAVSRSVTARPGLVELLDYLDDHPEVNTLIVPQWDRLIGGLTQHTSVLTRLREAGVRLFDYDGEVDYTDDDVLTDLERRSVSSAEEVRKARKRVRKALRQKARRGRVVSRPPFGLRMKPVTGPDGLPVPAGQVMLDVKGRAIRSGEFEADETVYGGRTAVDWLRWMFEATADDVPAAQVCQTLRAAGVRTKSGQVRWDATALARIIARDVYVGAYTWGRSRVVHVDYEDRKYVEPRAADSRDIVASTTTLGGIVEREVWERANAVLAERKRRKTRSRPAGAGFAHRAYAPRVAADLIVCGRCGMRMYPRIDYPRGKVQPAPSDVVWRYECHGKRKGAQGSVHRAHWHEQCTASHSVAERVILDALRDVVDASGAYAPSFVMARPVEVDTDAAVEAARSAVTAAQAKITRIRDLFIDGDIEDRDDMRRRIAVQEGIITDARATIDAAAQLAAAGAQAAAPVRQAAVKALRELLVEARRDWGDVERTTQYRDEVSGLLRAYVALIEVDGPVIRIHLRPTPAA